MKHAAIALTVLTVLTACETTEDDACPPFHLLEGETCVLDEPAVAEQMRHFDDGVLEQVNAEPFDQVLGVPVERNVFMNRLPTEDGTDTVELYRHVDPSTTEDSIPVAFPVGTVIVHERVDGIEGSTVQVRLSDDYANAGGEPWWFGKYFEDGTPDEAPCSPCEMCHNDAASSATEGLQGVPVEAWIPQD